MVVIGRDTGQWVGSFRGIADDDCFPSVRMQIGSLQLFLKESLDEALDRRVVSRRDTIHTDKSTALDQSGSSQDSRLFCLLLEELRGVNDGPIRGKGLRKRVDDGDRRTLPLACLLFGPRTLDGRLDRPPADRDLDRTRLCAGNGQHERCGISKITL